MRREMAKRFQPVANALPKFDVQLSEYDAHNLAKSSSENSSDLPAKNWLGNPQSSAHHRRAGRYCTCDICTPLSKAIKTRT